MENRFGEKLKEIRKSNKKTLREVANQANLSFSFISSIESGRYRPSKETVIALTAALAYPHVNEMLILSGYAPISETQSIDHQTLDLELSLELSRLTTEDKRYILELVRRIQK
jgi:transcriptional regulator with XRE-family HTH domain